MHRIEFAQRPVSRIGIVEKFRSELDITVNSSLFLEYPTLGALKRWLQEYYN